MKRTTNQLGESGKTFNVVIEYDPREPGPNKYAAFVPDLPGCQTDGRSREEAIENIRDAIKLYLLAERLIVRV